MSDASPAGEPPAREPAYAWRAGAAFALAATFFGYAFVQRVSPSVMVEDLMRDFGVGAAVLGNLSAFYFYAYAALQLPVGMMMDRFGPRRLMTAAAALCGTGAFVFAASETIGGAYVGRLLIGAGAAFSWVGVLTVVTQWFPARRLAFLGGLAQMVGMAGAVFGQAPLAFAVAIYGWRPTLALAASFALALAAALWLVVRDREAAHGHPGAAFGAGLKAVATNPQTWVCALFGLAMTGPMLAFGGLWGVPYMGAKFGLERAEAAVAVSAIFIGWGIAAPVIGWASDRIGRRRPLMIFCGALSCASMLGVLYVPGLGLAATVALIGVHGAAASVMMLSFAVVRELNPPAVTASAYGFVNTAVVGSGAVFQPLIGIVLDLYWGGEMVAGARVYAPDIYGLAFAVLPAGAALGVVAGLMLKETNCRSVV